MPVYHEIPSGCKRTSWGGFYVNRGDRTIEYSRWSDYHGNSAPFFESDAELIHVNSDLQSGYSLLSDKIPLPPELSEVLFRIRDLLEDRLRFYQFDYPARGTHIDFLYGEEVYHLTPHSFGLYDRLRENCEEFFEKHQREIRNLLEERLGVQYSRYNGFLD